MAMPSLVLAAKLLRRHNAAVSTLNLCRRSAEGTPNGNSRTPQINANLASNSSRSLRPVSRAGLTPMRVCARQFATSVIG